MVGIMVDMVGIMFGFFGFFFVFVFVAKTDGDWLIVRSANLQNISH
jgi:hypothetical protein